MPDHNKGEKPHAAAPRFGRSSREVQDRGRVMLRRCTVALAAFGLLLFVAGGALAQAGEAGPGDAVPKPNAPSAPGAPKMAKGGAEAPKPPAVTVAGNFGQWALVCGKEKDHD
jgi:hypothetical protein